MMLRFWADLVVCAFLFLMIFVTAGLLVLVSS
jgi:hypothetical protein